MCGRFIQYSDPETYAEAFGLGSVCETEPRYNLAPTQPVLAVRVRRDGSRALGHLRWGLIPHWSQGPDPRYSMINARAETVRTKPAYRDAFAARRCLVPSEGFYEWSGARGAKMPYLIRRADRRPFAMAGLWERWRDPDGGTVDSCTIIVTSANPLVARLHERMPVLLDPPAYGAWLAREHADLDALERLLRPADPAGWTAEPVARAVNDPRNDSPALLDPIEDLG